MAENALSWEEWQEALIREWMEYASQTEEQARQQKMELWREYYDRGLSPWDAIVADATDAEPPKD